MNTAWKWRRRKPRHEARDARVVRARPGRSCRTARRSSRAMKPGSCSDIVRFAHRMSCSHPALVLGEALEASPAAGTAGRRTRGPRARRRRSGRSRARRPRAPAGPSGRSSPSGAARPRSGRRSCSSSDESGDHEHRRAEAVLGQDLVGAAVRVEAPVVERDQDRPLAAGPSCRPGGSARTRAMRDRLEARAAAASPSARRTARCVTE